MLQVRIAGAISQKSLPEYSDRLSCSDFYIELCIHLSEEAFNGVLHQAAYCHRADTSRDRGDD